MQCDVCAGTDVINFLELCKLKRPKAAQTRTKISAFYHMNMVQQLVGLLIVLNFLMVITIFQFNPRAENTFKDVLNVLEYCAQSLLLFQVQSTNGHTIAGTHSRSSSLSSLL